jgi:hypothetical protein
MYKIKFHALYAFYGIFISLIVFHKFLETKMRFTLKIYSDPQLFFFRECLWVESNQEYHECTLRKSPCPNFGS